MVAVVAPAAAAEEVGLAVVVLVAAAAVWEAVVVPVAVEAGVEADPLVLRGSTVRDETFSSLDWSRLVFPLLRNCRYRTQCTHRLCP